MALKIRKNQSPPAPYDCPLSECLSVIGGTWTPNIIWMLIAGPRRFSELRHDLPRISAKMLTTRLRELEDKGVIERFVMPTSPPSVEYALTRDGRDLVPAIDAIAAVGKKLKRKKAKAA